MTDPNGADAASTRAPEPPEPATPEPAPLGAAAANVSYKGEPLDAERGPGLGCFRFQLVVLAILIVLTPLSVAWQWSYEISAILLFATLILLLVAGQTVIFLLRLVAADRRAAGRRRPLASATKTVGELEDEDSADEATADPSENAAGDRSESPSDAFTEDPADAPAAPGSERSGPRPDGVRE